MRIISGSGDDTEVYGLPVPTVIKGSGENYIVTSKIASFLLAKKASFEMMAPDFARYYCNYAPIKDLPMKSRGLTPDDVSLTDWFKNLVVFTKANNNFYPLVRSNDLLTIESWLTERKVPLDPTYRPPWESLGTAQIDCLKGATEIELATFERFGYLYECYLETHFAKYKTMVKSKIQPLDRKVLVEPEAVVNFYDSIGFLKSPLHDIEFGDHMIVSTELGDNRRFEPQQMRRLKDPMVKVDTFPAPLWYNRGFMPQTLDADGGPLEVFFIGDMRIMGSIVPIKVCGVLKTQVRVTSDWLPPRVDEAPPIGEVVTKYHIIDGDLDRFREMEGELLDADAARAVIDSCHRAYLKKYK